MAADAISSTSIQNLDSFPVIANTSGAGAAGSAKRTDDSVTPTTTGIGTTASKYKMVRLPMYAKVKHVTLNADGVLDTSGSPALTVNVGAYYSDSTVDGTPVALQGTVINATFFANAIAFAQSATTTQRVAADTNMSVANRSVPLWTALGLTYNPPNQTGAPPGGQVDVVVAVQASAATGASHPFSLEVEWVV